MSHNASGHFLLSIDSTARQGSFVRLSHHM